MKAAKSWGAVALLAVGMGGQAALGAGWETAPLLDETMQVPAAQWRAFDIELRQRPAIVECRYWVESGGGRVRVALMHPADLERLRAGVRHSELASTDYQTSGGLRYGPGPLGDYCLVVDNRQAGRDSAQVRLAVWLEFAGPYPEARELSPRRRLVVVLLALAYLAGVAVWAARRIQAARANCVRGGG
ncbi:MAG: hypothetical protein ACLQIS_11575 [Bryobacteraceae bacterium]